MSNKTQSISGEKKKNQRYSDKKIIEDMQKVSENVEVNKYGR